MISVILYRDKGNLRGFKVSGHAGYAPKGKDIVCAAVSSLVITTVNALEAFTEDEKTVVSDEEKGIIEVRFKGVPGHDADLLLRAMVLGLEEISRDQGFVKINEEVGSHD